MLYTMKTKHSRIRIILLPAGLLLAFFAVAQEQSVRPGINRHFEDPDWQRWVNTFERPGREVYEQRHAIVAASKLRPGMTVADIGAGTGLFTRLFAPAVEPDGTVRGRIVAFDFGIKRDITWSMAQRGYEVHVVPAATASMVIWACRRFGAEMVTITMASSRTTGRCLPKTTS